MITIGIDSGKCAHCGLSLFKVEKIFQLGHADLQVETMLSDESKDSLKNEVTLSPQRAISFVVS